MLYSGGSKRLLRGIMQKSKGVKKVQLGKKKSEGSINIGGGIFKIFFCSKMIKIYRRIKKATKIFSAPLLDFCEPTLNFIRLYAHLFSNIWITPFWKLFPLIFPDLTHIFKLLLKIITVRNLITFSIILTNKNCMDRFNPRPHQRQGKWTLHQN